MVDVEKLTDMAEKVEDYFFKNSCVVTNPCNTYEEIRVVPYYKIKSFADKICDAIIKIAEEDEKSWH